MWHLLEGREYKKVSPVTWGSSELDQFVSGSALWYPDNMKVSVVLSVDTLHNTPYLIGEESLYLLENHRLFEEMKDYEWVVNAYWSLFKKCNFLFVIYIYCFLIFFLF